jgi:ATP-dependent DNA helicase RecG
MEDVMDTHLLARPAFSDDGTSVAVTLSTTSTVTAEERAWLLGLERDTSLTSDERQLVMLAVREGSLTNSHTRTALGVDSVAARRLLIGLRDRGVLTQRGSRGGAQYLLSRDLAPPTATIVTTADLEAVIIELAGDGPLTNEQVRDATGLDRTAVLRALNRLVATGTLRRLGERRGSTYVLTAEAPG